MEWETYDQIMAPAEMQDLAVPIAIGATALVIREGRANPYAAAMIGLALLASLKRARFRLRGGAFSSQAITGRFMQRARHAAVNIVEI